MRRICHPKSTTQYSEINISPQWHQWLRHTRMEPPSLTEQSQDLVRQRNLKTLAAEADARWAAKPSFLDAPVKDDTPQPVHDLTNQATNAQYAKSADKKGARSVVGGESEDIPRRIELNNLGAEADAGELKGTDPDTTRREIGKHKRSKPAEDPWKQARGGPSEGWQPRGWDGNLITPRRE